MIPKAYLIYDTYILEEQRCDSNEGCMNLLKIEVSVYKNHVVVDRNFTRMIRLPLELLPLTDSNSTFINQKKNHSGWCRRIREGLKKDSLISSSSTLMDQESGKPIEIDGKPVTAETTLNQKSSVLPKWPFPFKYSSLKGKTIM